MKYEIARSRGLGYTLYTTWQPTYCLTELLLAASCSAAAMLTGARPAACCAGRAALRSARGHGHGHAWARAADGAAASACLQLQAPQPQRLRKPPGHLSPITTTVDYGLLLLLAAGRCGTASAATSGTLREQRTNNDIRPHSTAQHLTLDT
jgi:hypothetical protein